MIISKDIQETEKLLAEIDALEWLQAQIVVLTLGISNNNNGSAALGIRYSLTAVAASVVKS